LIGAALVPAVLPDRGVAQSADPAAVRLPQADTAPVARLGDPLRAGRPRDPITDYENDPFIVGVESRLKCTCGCTLDVYTCRTTDFTCGVSPAMHRQVVALVEQGKTAQEILDAFVAEHGETILMAPKKEGFNLAAYFVPGVAVAGVGALLVFVLARRRRVPAVAQVEGAAGLSTDEQSKLEAELKELKL
jgi:cytochrome c-type biogenesis protein CcmH